VSSINLFAPVILWIEIYNSGRKIIFFSWQKVINWLSAGFLLKLIDQMEAKVENQQHKINIYVLKELF